MSSEGSNTKYIFKRDSEPSSVERNTRNLCTWPCLTVTNEEGTSEATSSDSDENSNYVINHLQGNQNLQHQQIKKEKSLVMVDGETELELETMLKASAYVLGSSGVTIVYKAVLQDGSVFAVRRIGQSSIKKLKDFENQIRSIAKLQHQNLVRVRGLYWGDEEKLVICDYISNGSLANYSCRRIGSSPNHFSLETRLKIARGVARGLNFIHEKKYVHGNIKPSNILLTEEMEPILSDFGLQWLISGKNSSTFYGSHEQLAINGSDSLLDDLGDQHFNVNDLPGFARACPYRAPESLRKSKPNPKWDVYSYGILLLELLTGRVFADRDELSHWITNSNPIRVGHVAIRGEIVDREDAMPACLKLGFDCASWDPHQRPSMKHVFAVLEKFYC